VIKVGVVAPARVWSGAPAGRQGAARAGVRDRHIHPDGRNTAIIARAFDNEPDYTAGVVPVTTLSCTFTLPVVLVLATAGL
jgi:predicted permease